MAERGKEARVDFLAVAPARIHPPLSPPCTPAVILAAGIYIVAVKDVGCGPLLLLF